MLKKHQANNMPAAPKPIFDLRICKTGNPLADTIQMKVLADLGIALDDIKSDRRRLNRREYLSRQSKRNPRDTDRQDYDNRYVFLLAKCVSDDKALFEFLRSNLAGQVVVDLGCGKHSSIELTLKMMEKLGVSKYIGVDTAHCDGTSDCNQSTKLIARANKNGKIQAALVKEDMLLFAASLKDNSVNFLVSGIDDRILCDKKPRTFLPRGQPVYCEQTIHWHWKALVSDIARATKQNGLVFGNDRSVIGEYLEKLQGSFANFMPNKEKDIFANVCVDPYAYLKK
ncbi:MAG: hypothetical protein NT051_04610 [Candidatus Micrarchaeota archaeon]|nr:hypothetical protein [Candidatus Micrarchaeota archaeon]